MDIWRRVYGRQTTLVWLGRDRPGRASAGGGAARARVRASDWGRRRAGRECATAERRAAGWPRREYAAGCRAAERGAPEWPRRERATRREHAAEQWAAGWPGRPWWRGATWSWAPRRWRLWNGRMDALPIKADRRIIPVDHAGAADRAGGVDAARAQHRQRIQ